MRMGVDRAWPCVVGALAFGTSLAVQLDGGASGVSVVLAVGYSFMWSFCGAVAVVLVYAVRHARWWCDSNVGVLKRLREQVWDLRRLGHDREPYTRADFKRDAGKWFGAWQVGPFHVLFVVWAVCSVRGQWACAFPAGFLACLAFMFAVWSVSPPRVYPCEVQRALGAGYEVVEPCELACTGEYYVYTPFSVGGEPIVVWVSGTRLPVSVSDGGVVSDAGVVLEHGGDVGGVLGYETIDMVPEEVVSWSDRYQTDRVVGAVAWMISDFTSTLKVLLNADRSVVE